MKYYFFHSSYLSFYWSVVIHGILLLVAFLKLNILFRYRNISTNRGVIVKIHEMEHRIPKIGIMFGY